ncbi:RNA-binding protein 39 isoform X2 [Folsomia candida]|uniref:RNA-binding protein 39 isoform X2 n=1 Tax=Folsomia candida TaxID=158441 RepID=UPI000B8F7D72|nr:RNA-binding protein 39 isoform X2 [Folsomia candida]
MADDFDVDAMLEAAYQNKSGSGSSERHRHHRSDVFEEFGGGSGPEEDGSPSVGTNGSSKYGSDDRRERRSDRSEKEKSSSKKSSRRSRSRSPKSSRRRSSSREKKSHRSDRNRSKDRSSKRSSGRGSSKSPPSRNRSRSPTSRSSRRARSRSESPARGRGSRRGGRSRSRSPRSPLRLRDDEPLTPEERDARTVFCMQLSQRVRARDLEDFFSSVGKVRDVRMITCNKTRRFKGIAYVEFKDISSVALALGLGGQKLLGIPIIVQPSQAEKNRAGQMAKAGAMAAVMATSAPGPMKLYVGSLHFNITEEMLRGIFEPFGRIEEILLMKDHETGRSKGFGFITFHEGEDAKRSLEQLNGFEIAGRPMKVGYVTDKAETAYYANPQTFLDSDEMDRAGVNLGVTGRLQLMAKLAEGTDLKLPEAAASALQLQNQLQHALLTPSAAAITPVAPPIATQCFMLANMFDPTAEMGNDSLEQEIGDDVLEACLEHGGVVHVYVDGKSPEGNVYCKCPTVSAAVAAVNTFHGRWFAGRLITAAYVPLLNYHNLFPDAMAAQVILRPSAK